MGRMVQLARSPSRTRLFAGGSLAVSLLAGVLLVPLTASRADAACTACGSATVIQVAKRKRPPSPDPLPPIDVPDLTDDGELAWPAPPLVTSSPTARDPLPAPPSAKPGAPVPVTQGSVPGPQAAGTPTPAGQRPATQAPRPTTMVAGPPNRPPSIDLATAQRAVARAEANATQARRQAQQAAAAQRSAALAVQLAERNRAATSLAVQTATTPGQRSAAQARLVTVVADLQQATHRLRVATGHRATTVRAARSLGSAASSLAATGSPAPTVPVPLTQYAGYARTIPARHLGVTVSLAGLVIALLGMLGWLLVRDPRS